MDKVKHFVVGLLACMIVGYFTGPVSGLMLAATLGAAKEVYDSFTPGHEEFLDFMWTLLGGVIGFVALVSLTS